MMFRRFLETVLRFSQTPDFGLDVWFPLFPEGGDANVFSRQDSSCFCFLERGSSSILFMGDFFETQSDPKGKDGAGLG